jgi:hypothetical protein
MHPSLLREFQRHQEHDLKHPSSVDIITAKQNKLPSFIDRFGALVLPSLEISQHNFDFYVTEYMKLNNHLYWLIFCNLPWIPPCFGCLSQSYLVFGWLWEFHLILSIRFVFKLSSQFKHCAWGWFHPWMHFKWRPKHDFQLSMKF